MPFDILKEWLDDEQKSGAPNPRQAVLSTVNENSPHARVVAIREISDGLLFFTQKCTRKVEEIKNNPKATFTFWFELRQRQVIIEGMLEALSELENIPYWKTYPRQAQIRFYAYAPTSTQPISSKQELEEKRNQIEQEYLNKEIPMSPDYCGYRLKPNRFAFYEFRTPELSDAFEFKLEETSWKKKLLSP